MGNSTLSLNEHYVISYGHNPPVTDTRVSLREYCIAHAEWVILHGKVGPEPEMPPCLRQNRA